jgi:phytoene dehydrogenase-like protein
MNRSAIVVGSGPNGLAAAITLARGGCDVTVLEAASTVGGGMRTSELTLPGFAHDVCSAIHPMAVASPFFRSLPLERFGLEWLHAPAPIAHPLDDGAVVLERSLDATAAALGADGGAYRDLFGPLVERCDALLEGLLAPPLPPRHPLRMARFGWLGLRRARSLARNRFRGEQARALFAGLAAHSVISLDALGSASFALVMGMLGHAAGWPFPRGGSQAIATALGKYFESLGGRIVTGQRVTTWKDLTPARIVMFDITPRQLVVIAGDRLPSGYRHRLAAYRYGPAAFKLDWALRSPIPWLNPSCARAGTVHVGGTLDEIAESERAATSGRVSERPFLILAQPSRFDDTRAPAGSHTAWAYCHVPIGSTLDMTDRIERQVERFAPGFRDLILARHAFTPTAFEDYNANYVGGDIVGGSNDLRQILARPMLRMNPYATPVAGWYLCSASTPPAGGVHGMCGFNAAQSALRWLGDA